MEYNKIVIIRDGQTVKAKAYCQSLLLKSVEAVCSPSDTFDFNTGAKLAFERLMKDMPKMDKRPDKGEEVKLYCVKPVSGWLTKGKVYDSTNRSVKCDNGERHSARSMCSDGLLIPLIKRPAKVGEWVYVLDIAIGKEKDHVHKIGIVTRVPSERGLYATTENGVTLTLFTHEYLVLSGYQPEPEYEWVDGYKGFDANLKCRGLQYNVGGGVSLGESEAESECSKGFHFCKTLEDVYKHYADNGTNRFCKVRGYVKKGYAYTDKYCARKLEVVEEVTKPKGWSGKAVFIGRDCGFTANRVYNFFNGNTRDDDGDLRPCEYQIFDTSAEWFSSQFVAIID